MVFVNEGQDRDSMLHSELGDLGHVFLEHLMGKNQFFRIGLAEFELGVFHHDQSHPHQFSFMRNVLDFAVQKLLEILIWRLGNRLFCFNGGGFLKVFSEGILIGV